MAEPEAGGGAQAPCPTPLDQIQPDTAAETEGRWFSSLAVSLLFRKVAECLVCGRGLPAHNRRYCGRQCYRAMARNVRSRERTEKARARHLRGQRRRTPRDVSPTPG